MNAKQLKFLELFAAFAKTEPTDEKGLLKCFKALLEHDFLQAADVWEYLIVENEELLSDKKTAQLIGDKIFNLFFHKAQTKTIKAICDSAPIRRALYQYSPSAGDGELFLILSNLFCTNKIDDADNILKCLVKNTASKKTFGIMMKEHLERLFIELLKKSGGQKIEMSRKLSTLLLGYITKIKTDERAMLEQRIKEVQ